MKTIAIKSPDGLLAEIQRAARERGETRSAVMREALEEFFSRKADRNTVSCLDLARDLAGRVDGPPDLSTNHTGSDGLRSRSTHPTCQPWQKMK